MPVTGSRLMRTIGRLARPLTNGLGVLRAVAKSRDGNTAMIFGLAAIPVIIGAGLAIDTARAYTVKIRLASALDAAALSVGSHSNETSSTLTTELQNYFFNNYCKTVPSGTTITGCATTISGETGISASATNSITGATVNYQAQATVPTTFMRLVGVNQLTVTVTAQTTKFPGMEIAVVLDNTGSMLCGTDSSSSGPCAADVVTGDTNCTNPSNNSRICTLRNAALQFVTTLQNAITGPSSLYMSIVPYVTNVNVGPSFCTSSTSCSHITQTGSVFTDMRGNMMPVTPITGTTTSGSTTVSSISAANIAAMQPGMNIFGHGIPSGATVSSISSSSIVISSAATLTFSGNSLAVGPSSGSSNLSTPYIDPTTFNTTGTWNTSSKTITVASTTGVAVGMVVTSASSGIPTSPATTVSSFTATTVTLSVFPTAAQTNKTVIFSMAGNTTSGSTTISNLKGTTATLNSIVVGMPIGGSSGIPANAYVTSVTGSPPTSLTISAAASASVTGDILTLTNLGATTSTGSSTVYNASFSTMPSVGQIIIGNGIPANTTITAVTGTSAQFAAGTGQLTLSQNATTPSNFSGGSYPCPPSTGTAPCFNTTLVAFSPLTYDSAYNTASPAGSSTTTGWGGCVIEPTSSGENASGTGVLAVAGNPDTSEPVSGTSWYPYYWTKDTANNWTSATVARQDTTTEIQGGTYSDWLAQDGPNQGCPVPILPLTDLTTSAGQTSIQNRINDMWARDSGGTQVHVGMIWGWRVLSPNGPFTPNNGHPLDYSTAQDQGWKKIIVLMTDGAEEWPAANNMTGLGQIADGKIGTTSTSTAVTNLNTRLQTLCTNLLASTNGGTKNYMIYTIGLGSDGASNTQLQNCAGNGGFFSSATPANLSTVFQNIANSIIHLRLTR